jgi:hypothetical protein
MYSSNGFDIEIKEENNEICFDVIHNESNQRYFTKFKLPSNVTIYDLIDSFDKKFFQIFQIGDKIEIALSFNMNGFQEQKEFILEKANPIPSQKILNEEESSFSNLYNNSHKNKNNNNNIKNNLNNDNNNNVVNNNFVINHNFVNKNSENIKQIHNDNVNNDVKNLQFNINNNDNFNDIINNINKKHSKDNNNKINNNNINNNNVNNNNNNYKVLNTENNNINYNKNNNNYNNNYKVLNTENNNINYNKNNNNYNNNNNIKHKQTFNNKFFIKNKNNSALLFNLDMLHKKYDNIYLRMYKISKALNKLNKINLKKNPDLFITKQEMEKDIQQNGTKSKFFVLSLLQDE